MKSTVYKFDYKEGLLDNKIMYVRDYFQYYTTGVESVVQDVPQYFQMTERYDAERPEQIMFNIYNDADLADTFVAINNQNYLWSTPFDLDAFQDAIELKMNFLETLMGPKMSPKTLDTGAIEDPYYVNTSIENVDENILVESDNVRNIMEKRVTEDQHEEDDKARNILVPNPNYIQDVKRAIQMYISARELV